MTSTFKQDGVGEMRNGYDYSRSVNPTRTAFDEQLEAVEGGAYAMSFASGLAAIDVLMRSTLRPGGNVLIGNDVYGGTYRLLAKVFVPWGIGLDVVDIGLDVVDITDPAQVSAALAAKHYTYLWVETPSNPLLNITDIAATSALAHQYGTKVVVDNTFASPILQHPLADGADAVVYSTTKYIGGHSDVVGGAVVVNDEAMRDRIAFMQNSAGGGQHLRLADPAASARRRRRRRGLFDAEVHRRPLRRGRRRRGGQRLSHARPDRVYAELRGRGALASRRMARHARLEDARAARAAPQ